MKAVATLGPDNYVTDVKKKLSYLFSHALLARHSDDAIFDYETVSIQYHAMQNPDDPEQLASDLQTALNKYFSRNFDSSDITVEVPDYTSEDDYITVKFTGRVKQDNEWEYFGKSIFVNPSSGIVELSKVFSIEGI
jgi:hypothetical protein